MGSEILGYRIEELLGRGGMGVVYRAHDLRLKRNVALKLLAPELAQDRGFRQRFLLESEVAASLEHPNVVPIHDAGEVEGQLYLVMRYVAGRDLKTLLADGPLAPERAVAICGRVADALDAAHARGLVHRDVKPSNVLLDEREHVYLADFGLTRRLSGPPAGDLGLSLGPPMGSRVRRWPGNASSCCSAASAAAARPPSPSCAASSSWRARTPSSDPSGPSKGPWCATTQSVDPGSRSRSPASTNRRP